MCSLFCFKDQTSFFEFTPLYGLYPKAPAGMAFLGILEQSGVKAPDLFQKCRRAWLFSGFWNNPV
jgi:hypothetical protein